MNRRGNPWSDFGWELIAGIVDALVAVRFPRYARRQAGRLRKRRARPVGRELMRRLAISTAVFAFFEWGRRARHGFENADEARRLFEEKADAIRALSYEELAATLPAQRRILGFDFSGQYRQEGHLEGDSGTRYRWSISASRGHGRKAEIFVHLMMLQEDGLGFLGEELRVRRP